MFANSRDNVTLMALHKAWQGTTLQLQVIAGNIANLETPGYRARHVSFAQRLQQALEAPNLDRLQAIGRVQPEVAIDHSSPARADGNNVQIEHELTQLSKVALHHRLLTRLLSKKFEMLQAAISGGPGR